MSGSRSIAKRILGAGLPVPGFIRPVVRALYKSGVAIKEGSVFVRKFFFVEPVIRSICCKVGCGLRADRLPYVRGKGSLSVGDRANLSGRSCFYFMRGICECPEIALGDDVFIGNGCTFSAARLISVGSHCLISAGVRISDNDGHPVAAERRLAGEAISAEAVAPVFLEENVWIGAEAIILKGVRIGRNAIVGAGAVVTDDVPADTVVGGNPARILKKL